MNNAGTIIFIALILAFPWLCILIYIVITNSSIMKNYRSLGKKYGFEVDSSKKSGFFRHPVSRGQYRGFPVEISSFTKEEAGKKSHATMLNVDCTNHKGLSFIIVKKNKPNQITYGEKTFKMNDAELDSKFIMNTNDKEKMFGLLNFSIKYKLQQLVNVGFKGEMQLSGSKLKYEEKELIKGSINLLRIEILLHLLCEIADELKRSES